MRRRNDFDKNKREGGRADEERRTGGYSGGRPPRQERSRDYESRERKERSGPESTPSFRDKPFRKHRDQEGSERPADRPRGERPFGRKEDGNGPGRSSRFKPENGRDEKRGFGRRSSSTHTPRIAKNPSLDRSPRPGKAASDGLIRLNRFIANAGICSRREADELIESGQITVNGKVVNEMGFKVKASDVVKYGKRILNAEKLVYILINKPKDFLTTTDDPEDRRTVLDLISGACEERVYPVGRLDRNTTGLLLITNDGELADKLTHPSNNIKKVYQAELDKPIALEDFEAIKQGIELEDGFIKPDDLGIVTPDAYVVGIEIHSGRNRIVRRIFEHFGYDVKKLDRTTFAGLTKKDLPRGKWRFLTQKEVVTLKFLV